MTLADALLAVSRRDRNADIAECADVIAAAYFSMRERAINAEVYGQKLSKKLRAAEAAAKLPATRRAARK